MTSIADRPSGGTANSPQTGADRYSRAGVSLDRAQAFVERIKPLAASTARPGADAALGGFGGLFDPKAAGLIDPILIGASDGVGTKVLLGTEADRLEGLGIDLVAMCVNDLLAQGGTPLFFLDYLATGALDPERMARVVAGIAEGCGQAGCALLGGETAEMPGLYAPGHFDLAGFALGAVERGCALPRNDVAAGDVILGVASSGLHSNGFSLVRAILAESGADLAAKAPFATDRTLAEALLEPTRIYARAVASALAAGGPKAIAHITGGGFFENLPRVLPAGSGARIDARSWRPPAVFGWLAEQGALEPRELVRAFNGGIGLIAIVAPEDAGALTEALGSDGDRVTAIGEVIEARDPRVVFEGLDRSWALGE